MTEPDWVLFLNGTFGVGKSSVLDQIGNLLADANVPFSLFDVDWFHRSWPPSPDDPNSLQLEAHNIAVVWRHYRAAGPRQPVACGVLAGPGDRGRYAEAFGIPIRSVRLEASGTTTHTRLLARHGRVRPTAMDWHLSRHQRLTQELQAADDDEFVLVTDDLTPHQVAVRVLELFGLGVPES